MYTSDQPEPIDTDSPSNGKDPVAPVSSQDLISEEEIHHDCNEVDDHISTPQCEEIFKVICSINKLLNIFTRSLVAALQSHARRYDSNTTEPGRPNPYIQGTEEPQSNPPESDNDSDEVELPLPISYGQGLEEDHYFAAAADLEPGDDQVPHIA